MTRLYIDDIRNPSTPHDWVIVRSSNEAIKFLLSYGCPSYISFDHDLGGEDTSMEVVKFIVEEDMDDNGEFIPDDFEFNVHSANPVGSANIKGYLDSYLTTKFNDQWKVTMMNMNG